MPVFCELVLPPVLLANIFQFSGCHKATLDALTCTKYPSHFNFIRRVKLTDASGEDRMLTLQSSILFGMIAIMYAGGRSPNVQAHISRPAVDLDR